MASPNDRDEDEKSPRNYDHARLTEQETACIRRFKAEGAASIEVTSTLLTRQAAVESGDALRWYRVAIRRLENVERGTPYSLANIGVQAKHWSVALLRVTGSSVKLIREYGKAQLGPFTGVEQTVNQRLRRVQPKDSPADPALVWLLNFEGDSCELVIASRRPPVEYGEVKPTESKDEVCSMSEHDAWPPPPEGGGEEEEEPECEPPDNCDEDGEDDGE
ncbi:MAG: hypothetical protein V4773_24435 [Verrucomicrobiota bacterium]